MAEWGLEPRSPVSQPPVPEWSCVLAEGDLALHGSIGSLSLSDLTSHGVFYTERFTTSGEEALIFQVYK